MAHSEICPVCSGAGVCYPREDPFGSTTAAKVPKTCHGCGGRGWVVVGTCVQPLVPAPITPTPLIPEWWYEYNHRWSIPMRVTC